MAATAARDRTIPRWQRELLPAVLGADHAELTEPGARLKRSLRDWVVDIVMFCFALGLGAAGTWQNRETAPLWLLIVDILLGLAVCGALWVRRYHPLASATAASAISGMATGAAIVGLFTVAIYCPARRAVQVALLSCAASAIFSAVYMSDGQYRTGDLVFGLVATVAAVGLGMFVRVRRELVLSLHERNRRLRAEQELRVQEARRAERDRIAREMHDVLAHRISLLSLHAGALEFRPDAPPEEIARAAEVIRTSARAAQEELREVIGVLRADSPEESLRPPQPTLTDLRMLVAESERAGMDVTVRAELEAERLPDTLSRTIYRLIQEALTNVRKHAPDQPVTIDLRGDQAAGVRVTIVNRPRPGAAATQPAGPEHDHVGSGTGLIGLSERVALTGGTLRHRALAGGGFELVAELPWS